MMVAPLEGIRILDLTRLLPGPFCTMMLADLGAEVLKIEEPNYGDPARNIPPRVKEEGSLFLTVNRNKKSVTLNLKDPRGVDAFLKLAATADVIIEGFRPGVVDRLGIGYKSTSAVNPKIIYCSLTGYGQTGPMAKRSGHDINYIGLGGALGYTVDAKGTPVIPAVQIADLGGGMVAAIAILSAVIARSRTEKGQYIDVSMLDSTISMLPFMASNFFALGNVETGIHTQLTGQYPFYSVYKTKDAKYLSLGALEPKFWQNFCNAIDRKDMVEKQFVKGKDRERLYTELRSLFLSRTRDEWIKLFADKDVCCEPVNSVADALSNPQAAERAMIFEMEHPVEGPIRQVGSPFKLSETPVRMTLPPPRLGEHTEEVLASAGYREDELRRLRRDGVTKEKRGWFEKITLRLMKAFGKV
jgi:crotonobetainyl-CoA:carnitine CoA-transferase CaiB-like acyl-CoA transferase